MNQRLLLRLVRLVQNPPSKRRIILVGVVLCIAAVLFGIETLVGWPEWAKVNRLR